MYGFCLFPSLCPFAWIPINGLIFISCLVAARIVAVLLVYFGHLDSLFVVRRLAHWSYCLMTFGNCNVFSVSLYYLQRLVSHLKSQHEVRNMDT